MTRVVLVTGGARGIGLACAERFAAQGDRVAVTYNSSPPPDGFFGVRCDVTSNDDVDAAFTAVEEHFGGPVEVLVSNAGITRDGLLLRMSEDDFTSVVDANLTAAYRVVKRASRAMLKARSGRIVLVSSVVGLLGSAGQANYAASKAGVVGMTLPIARDLSGEGIRVNTILPGIFDTPLLAGAPENVRAALGASVPFPKRLGMPHEYASLALEMIRNRYFNGEDVRLDGSIRMAPR